MGDILVRNVDDAAIARLKKKAKAAGTSVNEIARQALLAAAKPSKEEIWAEIDCIRERASAGRFHERHPRRSRQPLKAKRMTVVVDAARKAKIKVRRI